MFDSLSQLSSAMASRGVRVCYVKALSPNDNSKNQFYLGGNFEALNIFPVIEIKVDTAEVAGSKRERSKASLNFSWLLGETAEPAPRAQLILYPRYPEVRLSSLLAGTSGSFADILSSRDAGRLLFLGVTDEGQVLGYATSPESPITAEFNSTSNLRTSGVFKVWPTTESRLDTKTVLLQHLKDAYDAGFLAGSRLRSDGTIVPYNAGNAGGYTLECYLGIRPNSYSEPDFLGWELKQYGTAGPPNFRSKTPITLMTPEPTSGVYKDRGVANFIRRYGYPDQTGRSNRLNFGGIYRFGGPANKLTNLRLEIVGFDPGTPNVLSLSGEVALLTEEDEVAASWKFTDLLEHWNRKHASAAYVSSIKASINGISSYHFGPMVGLGEGTNFPLLLDAMMRGDVYLDPALKLVDGNGTECVKRRNQFRIKLSKMDSLYHDYSIVDLREISAEH